MNLLKDNRQIDWFWIENDLIDRDDLTIYEKMVYMVLVRHSDKESQSYPSYSTISRKVGCSSKQAQRAVSSLTEKGLVIKRIRKINGKKEKDSNLYFVGSAKRRDCESQQVETVSPNGRDCESQQVGTVSPSNNTHINNNINIYSSVIKKLNQLTNKNYKATTPKTKKLISSRLSEGFELNDFYKVIENKTKSWLGTDMEKFLRPETLFGTKFESYLNENVSCENQNKNQDEEIIEDFVPDLNFETLN